MLLSSAVYSNRRRAGLTLGADVIVITWMHRLLAAFVLAAATEEGAARPYLEQALAIFGKALGPEHPNTKIVRENLESLGAW